MKSGIVVVGGGKDSSTLNIELFIVIIAKGYLISSLFASTLFTVGLCLKPP